MIVCYYLAGVSMVLNRTVRKNAVFDHSALFFGALGCRDRNIMINNRK